MGRSTIRKSKGCVRRPNPQLIRQQFGFGGGMPSNACTSSPATGPCTRVHLTCEGFVGTPASLSGALLTQSIFGPRYASSQDRASMEDWSRSVERLHSKGMRPHWEGTLWGRLTAHAFLLPGMECAQLGISR